MQDFTLNPARSTPRTASRVSTHPPLEAVHAAPSTVISGRCTSMSRNQCDKTTNAPISYATIVIKEAGKTITGGVTDDKGDFSIKNLELKNYTLEVQYIGYKTYSTTLDFSATKKSVVLKIALEEEATQLAGVEVVSERSTIEQKIDRKIINVGKDLLSVIILFKRSLFIC